jgi:hypothetical protein
VQCAEFNRRDSILLKIIDRSKGENRPFELFSDRSNADLFLLYFLIEYPFFPSKNVVMLEVVSPFMNGF